MITLMAQGAEATGCREELASTREAGRCVLAMSLSAINRSDGGMIRVSEVALEPVWEAMQVWLRDDAVLGRRGGSQADLRQGDAEFQALRMGSSTSSA